MSGDLEPGLVAQVLREAEELRDPGADPDLEAVKTAILLEDALGIVLTDDDITADVLGDPDSVADLVERRGHA
ncbi:hypothetical protein [Nocardioides sp.]|uniref:hypothetical protein n=1 Tax=Nocardioides sp. TaxID=35761 RepID=UPI001A2A2DCC|nr:hypothetical protein [Nocardioides sp.]MBJ7355774.1 hypothetical protein [Nocardioides sp.]